MSGHFFHGWCDLWGIRRTYSGTVLGAVLQTAADDKNTSSAIIKSRREAILAVGERSWGRFKALCLLERCNIFACDLCCGSIYPEWNKHAEEDVWNKKQDLICSAQHIQGLQRIDRGSSKNCNKCTPPVHIVVHLPVVSFRRVWGEMQSYWKQYRWIVSNLPYVLFVRGWRCTGLRFPHRKGSV